MTTHVLFSRFTGLYLIAAGLLMSVALVGILNLVGYEPRDESNDDRSWVEVCDELAQHTFVMHYHQDSPYWPHMLEKWVDLADVCQPLRHIIERNK